MNEMKRNLSRWLLAKYTSVKIFACWKVGVTLYNFRVPFYADSHAINEKKTIL